MVITLIILSCIAFVSSLASLALSCYLAKCLESTLKSSITRELYSAKEELLGVEYRLESLMDKKLNDSANHLRELAQNDAVDLVEAVMSKQGNEPNSGSSLGIGSFNNLRG